MSDTSSWADEYDAKRRIRRDISNAKFKLEKAYPVEAAYGSRASLWGRGLQDGIVSHELYNQARTYYDKLWTYVGD